MGKQKRMLRPQLSIPSPSCGSPDNSINLSKLQFSHLWRGDSGAHLSVPSWGQNGVKTPPLTFTECLLCARQFYMDCFYFYSQQHDEVGTIIVLMLQMRKLRTEYKSLAKGVNPRQPDSQACASNHHAECLVHAWHTAAHPRRHTSSFLKTSSSPSQDWFSNSKRGSDLNRCLTTGLSSPPSGTVKAPACTSPSRAWHRWQRRREAVASPQPGKAQQQVLRGAHTRCPGHMSCHATEREAEGSFFHGANWV